MVSDKMKPTNKAALPVVLPKSTRMKSISISRSIFPLFLTVAFMACLLNFSISDGLSSLEQNNPVLLALRDYNLHHHHDMGPVTRSTMIATTTSSTDLDSDSASRGLEEEQSPDVVVVVEPIPNPEPADGHDTFSACMLVMVSLVFGRLSYIRTLNRCHIQHHLLTSRFSFSFVLVSKTGRQS
jgi:hypothetical protein